MVLEKVNEKYSDKEYYNKYKYDENNEKVSVHFRIAPGIANKLVEVIAVYRGYGIDKHELIKSELAALIISEFCDNLSDDEAALLDLFSKLKTFRDSESVENVDDISGGVVEC